jgi:hypothetical protein
MAINDIPSGLHLQRMESEKSLFEKAVEASKIQADNLVDQLTKAFNNPELLKETQENFKKALEDEVKERVEEQKENRKMMLEWGASASEIKKQEKLDEQEIAKIRKKSFESVSKSIESTKESVTRLQSGLDKSLEVYNDYRAQITNDIKELKAGGGTDAEIAAYLKKYAKIHEENTQDMVSSLENAKAELENLAKSGILDGKAKFLIKKQLTALEESYDLEAAKEKDNIFKELNDQVKDIFIESKQSRIAELEQLKIDKEREKRERGASKKGSLLTTLLGPLRAFTDPLLEAFTDKTTEEFITDKFMESEKNRQKEEYKAFESRNKIADLIENANEKLAELGINQRIDGFDIEDVRNHALNESNQKFLEHEQLMFNLMKAMPGDLTRRERDEAKKLADRKNLSRIAGSLAGPAEGVVVGHLESRYIKNDTAQAMALVSDRQENPLGVNSATEEELIENPLMDKTSPDQNTLLAKGGVIGAGFVFLAKKLAPNDEESKNMSEDGFDKNIMGFMKKNGLGLLKVAVPLAVMALGAAVLSKGLQMQKRDSDDAGKYFDEGDTARGVETFILGDRARLTEENANQELGYTAEKSARMAGGAGLLAAGGIGTAAMIGTVASAGGLAAAGGLTAVGTAGIAAMGAALPPALIAAAVVTAGMVVAKGTQEAFELGWDKNQAAIQKELADTMLSEDSTTIEKIKAGAAGLWKGFTGALAGAIREAGSVLDAETEIQNQKQLDFIKAQAEAGNEGHQRLFEMMQSEQFKAMSEEEQKAAMQAEGLYNEFREAQEATRKTLGDQLLTAERTVGGFLGGLIDTTMEGMRGMETAVWEKAALKGMEDMTGEDADRFKQSKDYQEAIANGKDHGGAMQAAWLAEKREKAIARGDLREDGMAIQEGNWLAGMAAGAATGGIPGAVTGAMGGAAFGKYLGFGDTGMAYKKKQSAEEYRQTFEYTQRKLKLMDEGIPAEKADLAAIEEQNALYEQAMTLRLKQSKEYKKEFDKQVAEGKSIKQAEEAALVAAKENKRNTMTTTELVKDKFHEMGETLGGWARNIGEFFKEKFSEAGEGLANIGGMIKEGAQGVWDAVSEWFSGIWRGIGDKIKGALGAISRGWDWAKGKAGEGLDWFTGLFSGDDSQHVPERINDGIVTKEGKVIELSPDDNVYATKNEPRVIRDREAQAAMPDVPRLPAEFTDAGIIAAIQVLTDVLKNKEMAAVVNSPGESVNFDQYRMADTLA